MPAHLGGNWTNVIKIQDIQEIWISILKPKKMFCQSIYHYKLFQIFRTDFTSGSVTASSSATDQTTGPNVMHLQLEQPPIMTAGGFCPI